MNIFVLDKDPQLAAEHHCNKHVVKMILESAQMLCAAHWYSLLNEGGKKLSDFSGMRDAREWVEQNFSANRLPPYTFTHVRHPCTIWASENIANYRWLLSLMRGLLDEYSIRYEKEHKCESVWTWLQKNEPTHIDQCEQMTEHPQAMPDECKAPGDPVKAYRNYYKLYKRKLAIWEPRAKTPNWF